MPPEEKTAAELCFPYSDRVIYGKNPLIEVTCQLKFAPILRIESQTPAEFQECIRADFPLLVERTQMQLPAGVPEHFANMVRSSFPKQAPIAYDFASEDGAWSIQLTRDYIALTTGAYRKWEDFKKRFGSGLQALLNVYKPVFFSRAGLRYQDLIQRSRLGLAEQSWGSLLKPQITGLLAEKFGVGESLSTVLVRLPAVHGNVRIRHGLAQALGVQEECYLVDSDFFTERRMDPDEAVRALDYFNVESGRLFRWCISDTLHSAMEPGPVGEFH